jgi:ketosteroid isomerase-like protein
MSARSMLAAVHLWLGAAARGDGETLRALAHPDYRYEAAGVELGIDPVADGWRACRHAFPDLSVDVVDAAVDGDAAVAGVVWTGSQDGAVLHPHGVSAGSGGRIRLADTVLLHRRDGRVALERHRGGFLTLVGPLYGAVYDRAERR